MAAREAQEKKTGKGTRGPKPKPPQGGVRDKDQINLSDEDSRIMQSGGGFEQCYNAQATVETESLLVVVAQVSQAPNDKKELSPALTALAELPEELGHTEAVLADNGYFSQGNVDLCVQEQVTPYISLGREKHHQSPEERLREPDPICEDANALAVNPTGLGGVDLTQSNGNTMTGIALTSGVDHPNATITLRV